MIELCERKKIGPKNLLGITFKILSKNSVTRSDSTCSKQLIFGFLVQDEIPMAILDKLDKPRQKTRME